MMMMMILRLMDVKANLCDIWPLVLLLLFFLQFLRIFFSTKRSFFSTTHSLSSSLLLMLFVENNTTKKDERSGERGPFALGSNCCYFFFRSLFLFCIQLVMAFSLLFCVLFSIISFLHLLLFSPPLILFSREKTTPSSSFFAIHMLIFCS